ncbi:hypothetical protein BS78_06G243100 [Paspalum vaginatum]|nr:hypothetical protein BS78_06G243100 [Paspalum vaginatum]
MRPSRSDRTSSDRLVTTREAEEELVIGLSRLATHTTYKRVLEFAGEKKPRAKTLLLEISLWPGKMRGFEGVNWSSEAPHRETNKSQGRSRSREEMEPIPIPFCTSAARGLTKMTPKFALQNMS